MAVGEACQRQRKPATAASLSLTSRLALSLSSSVRCSLSCTRASCWCTSWILRTTRTPFDVSHSCSATRRVPCQNRIHFSNSSRSIVPELLVSIVRSTAARVLALHVTSRRLKAVSSSGIVTVADPSCERGYSAGEQSAVGKHKHMNNHPFPRRARWGLTLSSAEKKLPKLLHVWP